MEYVQNLLLKITRKQQEEKLLKKLKYQKISKIFIYAERRVKIKLIT